MVVHSDQKSQGKEVIDQYFKAAKICLDTKIDDKNNCLGYPAATLLFSIIDAISSYKKPKQSGCCFDILKDYPFDLTEQNIIEIGDWYRHKLSHAGSMVSGVSLSNDGNQCFLFSKKNELTNIDIGCLYSKLESKWISIRPVFDPSAQSTTKKQISEASPLLSSYTNPTSGSLPVSGVA